MNRKKVVNESYQCLVAKYPKRAYTQAPVKPVELQYKNKFDKFNKGLSLFEYGFEIFKTYVQGNDGNRIKETRNTVKSYLDEEGGIDTEYEIEFEIEWGGNLKMHSIMPKGTHTLGNKPTYMRYYTEKIIIKTKNPKGIYTVNNPVVKKVEKDMNKDPKKDVDKKYDQKKEIDEFMKRVKDDIPLRLSRKIKEYVDPPSEEKIRERSRTA